MNRLRGERGFGLVLSLLTLTILSMFCVSVVFSLRALKKETLYQKRLYEAQSLADSGANDAMRILVSTASWRTTITKTLGTGSSYTVRLSGNERPTIKSTGYSASLALIGQPNRTVEMKVDVLPVYSKKFALLSSRDTDLTSGGRRVDSYDSTVSTEPSVFTSSAVIYSNRDLTLNTSSGTQVFGDAYYNRVLTGGDASAVSGTLQDVGVSTTFPTFPVGDYATYNDNLTGVNPSSYYNSFTRILSIPADSTCTLRSGVYYFDNVTLNDDGVLKLDITNGPVIIYTTDDFDMRTDDTQLINPTKVPQNFFVYMNLGTNNFMELRSTKAPIYGVFFSVGDLRINGTVYGAAWARDISWNANGIIHQDLSLKRASVNVVRVVPTTWTTTYKKQ